MLPLFDFWGTDMAKQKQERVEFRYYDIPAEHPVLVLSGDGWKRYYGHDALFLHFHNILEIGYCKSGQGEMWYEEERKAYRGGMISVIPGSVAHNTVSEGLAYWEYVFIDVQQLLKEWNDGKGMFWRGVAERINSGCLLLEEECRPEMGKLIREIVREHEQQRPYQKEVIKGLAFALLMMISRENSACAKRQEEGEKSVHRRIQSVLEYVQREYAGELGSGDLAKFVNMSETHFRRLFVQIVDLSPMDYVNMVRIQKACELMRKSDDSMEQVAAKVGYQTITTFNRNFKKFMGTSPYQWKRNDGGQDEARRSADYRITVRKGWE